jgi:hypothetical protein
MEWPTVKETVSVSAHRQVDLAPWQGTAAPEAEAQPDAPAPPPVAPEASAGRQAEPLLEAW